MTLQMSEPFLVVMQASEAVAQELQRQLEEKQSEFEGKQAEIESLGSRLTASIEQVSTVHKELASAQQRHNIDTQVCIIYACFKAPLLQLLVLWCICSTSCCTHAITVLEP